MSDSIMISAEDLDRLHRAELEIMDEIHRICMKHDISYFLDSGTALGAIRHGGFIPWDDDVDVGMLRADYEKFIKVARDELAPAFFLQTFESERYYSKFNAKIRMNNTLFPEEASVGLGNRGISIDVFPFDYIEDEKDKATARIDKSRILIKAVLHTRPDFAPKRLKNKLIRLLLNKKRYHIYRSKYEKCIKEVNEHPTSHVTCFIYHMIEKQYITFALEDIYPIKPIRFEDRTYMIMNNPDAYLTEMYGDYMVLPPEEKRVCHAGGKIIFDLGVKMDENS